MESIIQKILGQPWISFPLVMIAGGVCAYYLYPKIERRVLERAFGKKEEIKKLLEIMFISIEEKKLDRLILLINLGPSILIFLIFWPNFILGGIVGFIVWMIASQAPYYYFKNIFEKRANLLVSQMIDGLTIMSNGVKAGLSVPQSMERVVDSLPNPLSQEFNLMLSQMRLGRSLEEALVEFGERIPKPDIQMFVVSINILKETGGNLAETFSTIVTVIRERQKVEQKIQAMTTQGKMQGLIISAIPIVIIAIFYFSDPTYIEPLFSTTLGVILLLFMFGLIAAAGLMIKKIVTIKV
jgi:tight adherence protein B